MQKASSVGLFLVLGLIGGAAVMACSSTVTETAGAGGGAGADGGPTSSQSSIDPNEPEPPHALGTILLGESHESNGDSSPLVSVSFVPDSTLSHSCAKSLTDQCSIVEAPDCGNALNGCATDEVCAFDDGCNPTCKKVPVCKTTCDDDEVCTVSKDGDSTCAKVQSFDAGPIAFGGTTTSITLFPPYPFKGTGSGAPFLGSSEIKVQAQGSTGAGFPKFDETFTSTTFVQTIPSLSKLAAADVFGTGDLAIGWAPGNDAILISVSGTGGTISCKATDSVGKFAVPRDVITKALGSATSSGVAGLSISVTRQRKETKKGIQTVGSLTNATVQPEGWLDLVTESTESASLTGCLGGATDCNGYCTDVSSDKNNCGACNNYCGATGATCVDGACKAAPTCSASQTLCDSKCVNLNSDPNNCGFCDFPCAASETCSAGTCVSGPSNVRSCLNCMDAAETGTCATSWNSCAANAGCKATFTCIDNCGTDDCINQCNVTNPPGTLANAFNSCFSAACATQCQ